MNAFNKRIALAAVAIGGLFFGVAASATPVTMHFDHLHQSGEYVHEYYDGGCGFPLIGSPTCGGPDYGVVWKGAALAGAGYKAPSGPNVMTKAGLTSDPIVMNVADGFSSGFSFYYLSLLSGTTVTLWDGLDGSGAALATTGTLSATHCGLFGLDRCWRFVDDLDFTGIARSVTFDTWDLNTAFDDIRFDMGSGTVAVPEPRAWGMFGLGVLLIGLFAGLRRRTRQGAARGNSA